MWLALSAFQLASLLLTQAKHACIGHSTFRRPANSDIEVFCGSQMVTLQILLCPIYFNGYNESLVSLNSKHSNEHCKGIVDWTADTPVIKFNFSITEEEISTCSNKLTVSQEVGTGLFSGFSTIQYINISGMVRSEDPITEAITYHQEVIYKFSCRYPLQYLVNNTQMSVSGVSLAVKDSNGSFISTLSMQLYPDNQYTSVLQIPPGGLQLKTRIFVEVKASNLTNRFNVLLDRCYATVSPFSVNTAYHDLFVGRRRSIRDDQDTSVSEIATVSSGPITIRMNNDYLSAEGGHHQTDVIDGMLAVSVVAGIVGLVCISLVAFIVVHMKKSTINFNKTILSNQK
ncbi:zona pellucida-like domain-containing protein 1 isoform X2 [Vanacampus margaritifer]